jgi:hypothetical protein
MAFSKGKLRGIDHFGKKSYQTNVYLYDLDYRLHLNTFYSA